ncbi:MAG TPA: HEAT repeat domain-containing protein [Gemmataceae bacterium]
MSMLRRLGLATLVVVCGSWAASEAHAHGFGPCWHCRPWYGPGWGIGGFGLGLGAGLGLGLGAGYGLGYYRPYPVYVGAPPVVVQQPVVLQQPVVAQPAYPPSAQPPAQAPAPLPAPRPLPSAAAPSSSDVTPAVATGANNGAADLDFYVQQLRGGDEQTRADALIRLGKMQAERAVGPMVKALNSDASPRVREAAARGLGLIASPSSLSALQYAAQADDDREVRRSASFAAEVIRGNLRR